MLKEIFLNKLNKKNHIKITRSYVNYKFKENEVNEKHIPLIKKNLYIPSLDEEEEIKSKLNSQRSMRRVGRHFENIINFSICEHYKYIPDLFKEENIGELSIQEEIDRINLSESILSRYHHHWMSKYENEPTFRGTVDSRKVFCSIHKKILDYCPTLLNNIRIEELRKILYLDIDMDLRDSRLKDDFKEKENDKPEEEKFSDICEVMMALGLTEPRAKYMAAIALGFEREDLMAATGKNNKNVDNLKSECADKLGASKKNRYDKDKFLKEIALESSQPGLREKIITLLNGDIEQRIETLRTIKQNEQIADMVRSNPQMMEIYKQMMQGNQNS